jgi:hypothetical protein
MLEHIMKDQKDQKGQEKQRVLDSDAENEKRERMGTQQPGNVPYSSGKNRDMQTQRSNRQGDGNPTQQGRDDR